MVRGKSSETIRGKGLKRMIHEWIFFSVNKPEVRGRRGEYSAPASMRTSPTNSGLLLATTALPPANDSTMEELQAAIQAAIAHCKNSIAKEEKLSCWYKRGRFFFFFVTSCAYYCHSFCICLNNTFFDYIYP